MIVYRSVSNQMGWGIHLSRCTIYSSFRWSVYINYGYRTISLSWKENPPFPHQKTP